MYFTVKIQMTVGKRLYGIRLDSGDLAYLSKKVRTMLDAAGLTDCKNIVSNSLDEYTIRSILEQGGCIDSFGVGERLITAKSDPVFGAVYKISAVEKDGVCVPRIKLSETVDFTTPFRYVDPHKPWKIRSFEGCTAKELQIPLIRDGKAVYKSPAYYELKMELLEEYQNCKGE